MIFIVFLIVIGLAVFIYYLKTLYDRLMGRLDYLDKEIQHLKSIQPIDVEEEVVKEAYESEKEPDE